MNWWPLFPSPLTAFDYALFVTLLLAGGFNLYLRWRSARDRDLMTEADEQRWVRSNERRHNKPNRRNPHA